MDKKLFYLKTLNKVIKDRESKILILAGRALDRKIFSDLGFKNVTISYFDNHNINQNNEPVNWDRFVTETYKFVVQDQENLTFQDNEFDYAVINSGLKCCKSPHKLLLEMYRVSKKGILSIEAKDSLLIKLAVNFKLVYQYDIVSFFLNDKKNNMEIPNFIYRWTEHEVEKVINCYAPFSKHDIRFFYDFSLPKFNTKFPFKELFIKIIQIALKLIPKNQGNLFAFFIEKPDLDNDSFPWIIHKKNKLSIDKEWLKNNWMKKQ